MIKNRTALRERTGVGVGHEKGERKGIYNLLLCQRPLYALYPASRINPRP